MSRFGLLRTLVLCSIWMLGCSHHAEKTSVSQESTLEAEADTLSPKKQINLPRSQGVFWVQNSKFTELANGDPKFLLPTNADRGFGFSAPIGKKISKDANAFVIASQDLDLSQLQITEFKGVAIPQSLWASPVDDGNVAWIPSSGISIKLEILDDSQGVVEISLNKPLKPGFYVLHDDSMVRARKKEEVSAYYPFIIPHSSELEPWISEADLCFNQMNEKYGDLIKFDSPYFLDDKTLLKCALAQRLAWKAESKTETSLYKLRSLYLQSIHDISEPHTQAERIENAHPNGDGVQDALWKIESYAHILDLIKLYENLNAGNRLPLSTIHSVRGHYIFATNKNMDLELDKDDAYIQTLAWVPFVYLEASDPALESFFHAVLTSDQWQTLLLELLGAISYRQIQNVIQNRKDLQDWFKLLDEKLPANFRAKANAIKLRPTPEQLSLGPADFQGIPENEISSWMATLMQQEKTVSACLQNLGTFDGAFFILDQPLNGTTFGKDISGVLKDPIDQLRDNPVLSPEVIQCMLKAFGKLPSAAALNTTQKVRLAISIANQ